MNQNKCVRLYKVAMNKRRWEEAASKWVMNKVTQKFGKNAYFIEAKQRIGYVSDSLCMSRREPFQKIS